MARLDSCCDLLLLHSVPPRRSSDLFRTPGLPRMPDGKPNLVAPAPRTADGKPDLSGVWDTQDDPQVLHIAFGLKDGLPYRDGMAELVKARQQPPKIYEPLTRCLPVG